MDQATIADIIGTPFEGYGYLDTNTGCWMFKNAPCGSGYGSIWIGRKKVLIHRASWEYFNGKTIPKGHTIDHLCEQPLCFNPYLPHTEPVIHRVNVGRYVEKHIRINPFPCGHPRTSENSAPNGVNSVGNPSTRCRICNRKRRGIG